MKTKTVICRGIPPSLALAAVLAAAQAGCSRPVDNDIPREEREFLESWAARLAPAMVLSGDLAPSPPDTSGLGGLIEFCDGDPARYLYLYGCLKDSIGSVPPPEIDYATLQETDSSEVADSTAVSVQQDSVTDQAGSP